MTNGMTKAKWMRIAREFEIYANGGRRTNLTEFGLCYATRQLGGQDYEIQEWCGVHSDHFWWDFSPNGHAQRAIFATLMAENCGS